MITSKTQDLHFQTTEFAQLLDGKIGLDGGPVYIRHFAVQATLQNGTSWYRIVGSEVLCNGEDSDGENIVRDPFNWEGRTQTLSNNLNSIPQPNLNPKVWWDFQEVQEKLNL